MSSRAWENLNPALSEWILDAVLAMGFNRMTPVQASAIPLFMGHKDVVVEAVTGSGKTLSYLIPVVEKLLRLDEPLKKNHVGAIILSPTRELAAQIYDVLKELLMFHAPSASVLDNVWREDHEMENIDGPLPSELYAKAPKIVPQLLVGGDISTSQDRKTFIERGSNLLIGTPGRLLELLNSPRVHCPQSSFQVLVLDEADRMLDIGFKEDLQKIIGQLPKQRRTGLFSASVSEAVDQIIRVGLRNPVKIVVKVKSASGKEDQRTPASLQMNYLITPASHKLPSLRKLLQNLEHVPNKTIVYLSTCAAVDYFQFILPALLPQRDGQGFSLVPLHGKHPPSVRQKNFTLFRNSVLPSILLTTDVAARGLDIPQVDLVVQVDPPSDPKVFLHRCGRAGRAGRKGLSVVLIQPGREEDYIEFLNVRKTPVTPLTSPSVQMTSEEVQVATKIMRRIVMTDRAIHDKAQRGFVSWAQSYSKHQASSIFRISDIDWEDVGNAWALLKLPKMPELKKWDGDRSLGVSMDFAMYAYKDKKKEEVRKAEARSREEETLSENHGVPGLAMSKKRAWSQKLDAKEERERRRTKRQTKQKQKKWQEMTPAEKEEYREMERLVEEVKKQGNPADTEDFQGFGD